MAIYGSNIKQNDTICERKRKSEKLVTITNYRKTISSCSSTAHFSMCNASEKAAPGVRALLFTLCISFYIDITIIVDSNVTFHSKTVPFPYPCTWSEVSQEMSCDIIQNVE